MAKRKSEINRYGEIVDTVEQEEPEQGTEITGSENSEERAEIARGEDSEQEAEIRGDDQEELSALHYILCSIGTGSVGVLLIIALIFHLLWDY